MGFITTAYHFVSALINCGVQHGAEVIKTVVDLGVCVTAKLFQ